MLGFRFFNDSPPPRGASDSSGDGRLFKALARQVGHRRPFFRRGHRGLLCGASVEPPRGRGRPSGARESQLFFGYNRNIFKDPLGCHYHYRYRATRIFVAHCRKSRVSSRRRWCGCYSNIPLVLPHRLDVCRKPMFTAIGQFIRMQHNRPCSPTTATLFVRRTYARVKHNLTLKNVFLLSVLQVYTNRI